jgi:O-antigen ligase
VRILRAFPRDQFLPLRAVAFGAGGLLVLLAASGVFENTLFTQPSTLKYAVTVAGSALVALLATMKAPLRFLVGLAIVVAPFAFVSTFSGIEVTPLLAVEVLAVLAALPRQGGGLSNLRPAGAVFVLLMIPAVVTSDRIGHWVLWITLTALTGWLSFQIAREPSGPQFVAAMLTLSALVQGALAIWEFKTGHQLNLYQSSGSAATSDTYFFNYGGVTRSSGALPDPIGLGQVLALCIPISVALAASLRRWSRSIIVLCLTGVAALGLVLSLSRMSIIGAIAGLVLTLFLLPGAARIRTWGSVALMIAVVVILGLGLGGSQLRTRINSILHPTAAHVSTAAGDVARVHIWHAAARTAEAHPITGVGLGNITKYLPRYGVPVTGAAHAHDTYLQVFAEAGILGLLGLLGLIAAAARDLMRARLSDRIWVAGGAGALLATLIAWSTDVAIRYVQVSAMVAVLLGLIAALSVRSASHKPSRDVDRWSPLPRPDEPARVRAAAVPP